MDIAFCKYAFNSSTKIQIKTLNELALLALIETRRKVQPCEDILACWWPQEDMKKSLRTSCTRDPLKYHPGMRDEAHTSRKLATQQSDTGDTA